MEQTFEQHANAHYAKNVLEYRFKELYDFLNNVEHGGFNLIRWFFLIDVRRANRSLTNYKWRTISKVIKVAFPNALEMLGTLYVNNTPYDTCVNVVMAEYAKIGVIKARAELQMISKHHRAAIKKLKAKDTKDMVTDESIPSAP